MHVALAAAYVGLMIYPSYLAGTAPGKPITAGRLAVYGAAIAISLAVGAALRPAWRYALPWLVAGALFVAEVALRIVGDIGMSRLLSSICRSGCWRAVKAAPCGLGDG